MHRLLANQIRKAGVTVAPEQAALFELVSKAYDQFEADRIRSDRAGQLMMEEVEDYNDQLQRLAYFDPLTGLANRAAFRIAVEKALAACDSTSRQGALLLLDLDRFKEVNDTLGHPAGDDLLKWVGGRIAGIIGARDVLARLGGDEFAVLLPQCSGPDQVMALAEAIRRVVSEAVQLGNGEMAVGASIGAVMMPGDGQSYDDLLRNVDLALYKAKENGRDRCEPFRAEMNTVLQNRTSLARDLRYALFKNEGLTLHYQPQVDLATGMVSGFEALLRWQHPWRGVIEPSEFMPIAESSNLTIDLGRYVLDAATRQAKAWLDAGEPLRVVSVNVWALHIGLGDLVKTVVAALDTSGLPPQALCLELTESVLAELDRARVQKVLNELSSLGVLLTLGDFGANYSSTGYLTQLPFDKLKIDSVFISGTLSSSRSSELLKGIIALGRGLGMDVVAEGAERAEEIKLLQTLGCGSVQGLALSPPTGAMDAIAFARASDAVVSAKTFLALADDDDLPIHETAPEPRQRLA